MPTLLSLSPHEYRRTRWKNGGGETSEIAVFPAAAGLDEFAWRVSIADVERDGPFSAFTGVDRSIVLLAGNGLRLTGNGRSLDVCVPFEPVDFAGDVAMHGALLGGPSRDFNLMVRRGMVRGDLVVVRERGVELPPADAVLCYVALGVVECASGTDAAQRIETDCTWVVTRHEAGIQTAARVRLLTDDAVALVATITRSAS